MKQLTVLFPPRWSIERNIFGTTRKLAMKDAIAFLLENKLPVKKIAERKYKVTLTTEQHTKELLDKDFLKDLRETGLQITAL